MPLGAAPAAGAGAALAPGIFIQATKAAEAKTLTDDVEMFTNWRENFTNVVLEQIGYPHVLERNHATRHAITAAQGITRPQMDTIQKKLWKLLHSTAMYSRKCQYILGQAAEDKNVYEFATLAFLAIWQKFDPMDHHAAEKHKDALKAAMNEPFTGSKFTDWFQKILFHYTKACWMGEQMSEQKMIRKMIKTIFKYAHSGTTLKHKCWSDMASNFISRTDGSNTTVRSLCAAALATEANIMKLKLTDEEPDTSSVKHTNDLSNLMTAFIAAAKPDAERKYVTEDKIMEIISQLPSPPRPANAAWQNAAQAHMAATSASAQIPGLADV